MLPLYIDPIIPLDVDGAARVAPVGYTDVNGTLYNSSPPGDFTGNAIVYALGSFWSQQFQDRGVLTAYAQASAVLALQNYINYLEAVACTSRFAVPVFHLRAWYALVVKESELNSSGPAVLKYGGSGEYGAGYRYGVPTGNEFYAVSAEELRSIAVIMNRIIEPSLTFVDGHDFHIVDGVIHFRFNPFNDERVTIRNVVDADGNVLDRECVLWAFSSLEDQSFIYQHYGYAIQSKAASSDGYRDLVNALWNGLVGGCSAQDLSWAIAATAGLSVVLDPIERIEKILKYDTKLVIVTDKRGYIYPAGSSAAFSVGDVVRGGTPLVDTARVFDLTTYSAVFELMTSQLAPAGTTSLAASSSSSASDTGTAFYNYAMASKLSPPINGAPLLRGLPLLRGMLGRGYEGALVFDNAVHGITAQVDAAGRLQGEFTGIAGSDADIERFWSVVHANGVASSTWLELYGAGHSQVNPAGFIVDNFLRNHGIVVHLRVSKISKTALGIRFLELLRRVMPPEKLLLLLIDIEIDESGDLETDVTCGSFSSSALNPSCEEVLFTSTEDAGVDVVAVTDNVPLVFAITECP